MSTVRYLIVTMNDDVTTTIEGDNWLADTPQVLVGFYKNRVGEVVAQVITDDMATWKQGDLLEALGGLFESTRAAIMRDEVLGERG